MTPPVPLPPLLGVAWGAIVAAPVVRYAHRAAPVARAGELASRPPPATARTTRPWHRVRSGVNATIRPLRTSVVARVLGSVTARRRTRALDAGRARELPVVLDLLGVAVGAGATPYLAVEVAAEWSPPVVAASLAGVLRAAALGASFESALDAAARATPALRPLTDALLASDRLGAPVGPVLARLAAEERAGLRRRAEAHARRVPVRLLFPLVFLVLPAFVLLTVVPGLAAGLGRL
jgi:tight adherence protein C